MTTSPSITGPDLAFEPKWGIESPATTMFDFNYTGGRDQLLRLYDKGTRRQWIGSDRLDWSQEVDLTNPVGMPDEMVPIFGTEWWDKMSDERKGELRRHFEAWRFSQFMHGEQGALICTAKIVQTVPDIDSKFYAATQVIDEARHVMFGRLALRDYYPQLTQAERDEREAFCIEACYLMRDRFLGEEIWERLDLPPEIRTYVENSETLRMFRNFLFMRIVPILRDIGLWGPKLRKAFEEMGVIGWAETDIDAEMADDEKAAQEYDEAHDARMAHVKAVAAEA